MQEAKAEDLLAFPLQKHSLTVPAWLLPRSTAPVRCCCSPSDWREQSKLAVLHAGYKAFHKHQLMGIPQRCPWELQYWMSGQPFVFSAGSQT